MKHFKAYVAGFVSAIALGAVGAQAADRIVPPENVKGWIPTGYQVSGCPNYKLDAATNRVIEQCKEDADAMWRRFADGGADEPDDGEGEGESN